MTMAITHLVDSSVYSQPLRPRPQSSVVARWQQLGDHRLAISTLCDAELLFGLELRSSPKLFALYEAVLRDRLPSLPVDFTVSRTFARVKASARRRGKTCSDVDFLIGATALVHELTVATLNPKHFVFIEGLAVEDWSS